MADRLTELKIVNSDKEPLINDQEENKEIEAYFHQYDVIKKGVESIKANVLKVKKFKEIDSNIANEQKRKENMDNMGQVLTKTNKIAAQMKTQFDTIQAQNAKYQKEHPEETSKCRMRHNLYQTHIRRYQEVMNEYKTTTHEFNQNLIERKKRQLKIVNSAISDEEADRIVAGGQADGVIKQALVSENLNDVIRDIEERHLDIVGLEQQVLEVFQLFQDLATLVDIQQESLDVIQTRIESAKNYAEKAEKELHVAERYQKKSRKRCCCILILLLCIMGVIMISILGTVLPKA